MPIRSSEATRIAENTNASIRRREQIEDFGFNLSPGSALDYLNPVHKTQEIRDAHYMWLKNPLANSMIELDLDFIFGDGLTFKAEDPQVQEVLDNYYNDPDNAWDIKGIDRYRDLVSYGELALGIIPSPGTGACKVQSYYPGNITQLYMDELIQDRINALEFNTEVTKSIIRYYPLQKKYRGDIFFWQINKPTFQLRGIGDIYFARDWLRMYDKSLYSTMERVGLLMSFVWDVQIEGATNAQLREKFNQISKNPPRPGSFRVHNEKETWNEKTPNLAGRDLSEIYRLLKSQIIASTRRPEHYFGMGDNVNRASADVMNTPYFKKIKRRQRFIKYTFEQQFNYVISKAIEYGTLPEDVNQKYQIMLPDPNDQVLFEFGANINQMASAVTVLETGGYISKDEASAIVKMLMGHLGVDEVSNPEETEEDEDKASGEAKGLASAALTEALKKRRKK